MLFLNEIKKRLSCILTVLAVVDAALLVLEGVGGYCPSGAQPCPQGGGIGSLRAGMGCLREGPAALSQRCSSHSIWGTHLAGAEMRD